MQAVCFSRYKCIIGWGINGPAHSSPSSHLRAARFHTYFTFMAPRSGAIHILHMLTMKRSKQCLRTMSIRLSQSSRIYSQYSSDYKGKIIMASLEHVPSGPSFFLDVFLCLYPVSRSILTHKICKRLSLQGFTVVFRALPISLAIFPHAIVTGRLSRYIIR